MTRFDFFRHVDLANTVTLRKVEETVQIISQDVSDEAEQLGENSPCFRVQSQAPRIPCRLKVVTCRISWIG